MIIFYNPIFHTIMDSAIELSAPIARARSRSQSPVNAQDCSDIIDTKKIINKYVKMIFSKNTQVVSKTLIDEIQNTMYSVLWRLKPAKSDPVVTFITTAETDKFKKELTLLCGQFDSDFNVDGCVQTAKYKFSKAGFYYL